MNKNNFILGENIITKIYSYDDQGTEYSREIKGKICQITNDFVVIDNGKYKESFKYSEFEKCTPGNIENEPYDLSLETYKKIKQSLKRYLAYIKRNLQCLPELDSAIYELNEKKMLKDSDLDSNKGMSI